MSDKSGLIAQYNDLFRQRMGLLLSPQARSIPGQLVVTAGIAALPLSVQAALLRGVMEFDEFTTDNDPYGEHDFGIIRHPEAGSVYWKIDYYEPSLQYGSEDPSDLTQTFRVLTVMLGSEY